MTNRDRRDLVCSWLLAMFGFGLCAWTAFDRWSYCAWATAQIKAGLMIASVPSATPDIFMWLGVGLVFIGIALWTTYSIVRKK